MYALQVTVIFGKCVKRKRIRIKRKKNEENFQKFDCISGTVEGIFFKFGMWLSLSGGHLHSKFGAIQMELHMRENRDFFFPVNMLTVLNTPCFLGLHDTLPCVFEAIKFW